MIGNTVGGLKRLRQSRLLAGCAVAALAGPAPLIAANLPTGGDVVSGIVKATAGFSGTNNGVGAGNPIVSDPLKTALDLEVTGGRAIVNWSQFNIDSGNVVTFNNAANVPYSVLNRVTGPSAPSIIGGTLKGGATGSATIWLINEAGITLQGSGVVSNLSGFVASSLNILDPNFLAADGTPLKFSSLTSNGAITLANGSTITTSGPVLLVAPSITASGSITATGDVGVVVAADATVQLQGNSIISVKIDSGTAIPNAKLTVAAGAAITGDHVYALAVSDALVINTLLQIDGSLTASMATAGPQGIVLSAGRNATHLVVAGPSKAVDVALTGSLVATGGNVEVSASRDITANVTAPLTLTSVDATRNVSLTGAGALTIGGVTAGGDYSATGASLTLGAASAVRAQTAQGSVTLKSTSGNIDALGTLAITSSSTGLGGSLILDSFANITGGAALAGGILGNASDVGIHTGVSTTSVILGDITGHALGNIAYVGGNPINGYTAVGPALSVAGSLNLGNVTVRGTALSLGSTGSTLNVAGATSTTGSVTLASLGALTLGSGSSAAGFDFIVGTAGSLAPASVTGIVNSGQDLTIAGSSVTATGSLGAVRDTVLTGGSVTLGEALLSHTIGAGRDVVVRSTSGDIVSAGSVTLTSNSDDDVAGGRILLDSFANISAPGANLAGGTINGTDIGIRLTAPTGSVTLGNITGHQLGNVNYVTANLPSSGYAAVGSTLTTPGAITLGNVTTSNALAIVSHNGGTTTGINVSTGALESTTGGVDVEALSGALLLTGAKSAVGQDVTLTSAQSLSATTGLIDSGGDVMAISTQGNATLGATTALGSITVSSALGATFAATVGASTAGRDITLTGGKVVVLGSAKAGDDVVLNAQAGTVVASSLTTTGLGTDSEVGAGARGGSNISVTATGDINIDGTLSSIRDFTATSTGGTTTLAIGSAGRDLTLTGSSIAVTTSATAGDDVVLNAQAGTVIASGLSTTGLGADTEGGGFGALGGSGILVTGTGAVTINGVSSSAGSLTATSTGGKTTLASGTAVRDLTLSGTDVAVTVSAAAGDDVVLNATSGTVVATDLSTTGLGADSEGAADPLAGSNISVTATSNVTINGTSSSKRDFTAISTGGTTTLAAGSAGRDLTLTGNDVAVTTSATAGDDVVLNAVAGTVVASGLTTTGLGTDTEGGGLGALGGSGILVTGTGAVTINGVSSSAGSLTATSTGGKTTLASGTAVRDLTLSGTDIAVTGSASAGDDVVLNASSGTVLATNLATTGLGSDTEGAADPLSGSNILVTGVGAVTINGISSSKRDFTATSTGGTTTLAAGSAGRDLTLTGNNVAVTTSATADDDVVLKALVGTVVASNLSTTGLGSDTEGAANPLSGSNILVTGVGAVTINGTSSSKRDFTATSTGGTTTLAAGSAVRDIVLTGGSVTLGQTAQTRTISAGRDVVVRSASGDIVSAGTVTLTSNSDDDVAGGRILLDSFGNIAAPGANLVGGAVNDTDIGIRLAALTSSVTLGNITGHQLGNVDYVTANTLSSGYAAVGGALATRGAITLGDVTTHNPLAIVSHDPGTTTGINVSAGDLESTTGAVDVSALSGALLITGAKSPTGITLTSAQSLTAAVGLIDSGGDVTVISTMGNATLGATTAPGSITVTSNAGAAFTATLGTAPGTNSAGRDITLTGGKVVVQGSTTAGDDIVLNAQAGTVVASSLTTNGLGTDSELGAGALAGSNISVTATSDVTINGTSSSKRDFTAISTGGTTTLAAGSALRDLTLTGNDVAVTTSATAGDDVVLNAVAGTVVASGLTTTGLGTDTEGGGFGALGGSGILVTGTGAVTINGVSSSAGSLTATSTGGKTTLASGTAVRDLTLSGTDVAVTTSASAGDDVVLVAASGTVVASGLTATGLGSDSEAGNEATQTLGLAGLGGSNIVVQASGDASVSGSSVSARNLTLRSLSGNAALATVTGARDIRVAAAPESAFTATLGDVQATRDITASGGNIAVTTSAKAGDDIVLVAGNGTVVANSLSATGSGVGSEADELTPTLGVLGLNGSNIVVQASSAATLTGTNSSARDLVVSSTGNAVQASTVTAGRDLVMTAANGFAATLAHGTATRDITISGGSVDVTTSATAGDDIVLLATGGAIIANSLSTAAVLGPDSEAGNEATTTLGISGLAGSNIVATASGNVTLNGTTASARDLRLGSGGATSLANGVAGRDITLSGHSVGVGGSATAGDDIVLVASSGSVVANGLSTTGAGPDSEANNEALTTLGLDTLAKSNISVLASGSVALSGTTASSRDLLVTSSGGNTGVATALAGRDIRLGSAPGNAFTASLANGTAGRDITMTGGNISVVTAKAGDDISLIASNGNVVAADLQTTGLGIDNEPGDPTLGGANVIVDASGTASVTGVVTSSNDYRVTGSNVVLGSSGATLTQNANGRVIVASTVGSIAFPGLNGTLRSNAGHTSIGTAGSLDLTAATSVSGATTNIEAATATGLNQASQPHAIITAAANSGGSVSLAKVSGGVVAIAAPNTISVPLVVASGDVEITGSAVSGNDVATIDPLLVTIDHAGVAGPVVPANVYIAAGHGASATIAVANGGHVGTVQISSDTGTAALLGTPATTADIDSILVESQHGLATIADAQAGTIAVRGRQSDSSATITGTATAAAGISLVGPTVIVNHADTGTGDLQLAATGDATLTLGTSSRNISVSAGGTASIGSAAASGRVNVAGGTVNVATSIDAGDDLILTGGSGGVTATTATLHAGGGTDLQAGDDSQNILVATTTNVVGGVYSGGNQVLELGSVMATSSVTGAALSQFGGSNIVLSGRDVTTGGAVTATRDIRYEAARNIGFATASADRDLIAAAGQSEAGTLTIGNTATAGDDLVLVSSNGSVLAGGATLTAAGGGVDGEAGSDLVAIKRADGSTLLDPTGTGSITRLGGANIVVAASDAATVLSATTAGQGRDIRIAADGVATLAAATARRDLLVLGGVVSTTGAITAGDDIAVVARSGPATVATAATTRTTTSNETLATDALLDLSGNALGLPGEAPLVRLDRSSIVIATVDLASVDGAVSSAGRYTVIGRGGVSLGGAGTVVQTAAGDVLIAASLGTSVPDRDVTLLNTLSLRSNEDGLGTGDGMRFLLGSGSINGAAATLTVGRSAAETLANQGVLSTVLLPGDAPQTNNTKDITLALADAPWIDLRATGNVLVTDAIFDGGMTLASSAGSVALSTATVANGVPLITTPEAGAIDLRLFGTTGAALGSTAIASDGKLRDVTVATTGGTASITRAAARDDIVVASTNGAATAQTLILTGAASDSELGNAGATLADANGVALVDPYQLTGPAIASLQGSNIVVSGGTGATLVSGTAAGTANDVRVQTFNGAAMLTTGLAPSARVFVGSRNGSATATSAMANDITLQGATALLTLGTAGRDVSVSSSAGAATIASASTGRDLFIAATGGPATLTAGAALRDITITGPSVVIGTATAGDDIVAVASAGTLVGTTLTATGLGPDSEADDTTVAKAADGSTILDPTLVVATPITGLTASNVVALATGDVTLDTVVAAGGVRLGSLNGTATAINTTSTSGDLIITAAIIDAMALSAGRDIKLRSTVGSTSATTLDAVRDLKIDAKTDVVVRNTAVAGNSVAIDALQDISIGTLAPLNTTVLTATAGSATLHAGGDINVLGLAKTGTAFSADADTVTLASLDAGTTADLVGATDVTITGTAKSGGNFTATATGGDLQLASLDSGAGATLTALHGIVVTGLAHTIGSFKADGGTIALGLVDAGATADLTSVGDTTISGTALSVGDFTATSTAGNLLLASLGSGGAATLTAAQNLTVAGLAKTTDAFKATGGTIMLGSLVAGTTADLAATSDLTVIGAAVSGQAFTGTATAGNLTLASLDAGGDVTLVAGQAIGIAGLAKSTGAFTATGGTIALGTLTAGTTAQLTAANAVAVAGTASSGGNFTAKLTNGSLGFATLTSGGTALLNAGTGIAVTGVASSAGDFSATAASGIALGTLTSGGQVALLSANDTVVTNQAKSTGAFTATSTGGGLHLGSIDAGAAVQLTAGTTIVVDGAAKSAGALVAKANGGAATFGSLASGDLATLTASGNIGVTGAATSVGPVTATSGGGIAIGSLDAGATATLLAANDLAITGLAKSGGAFDARSTAGSIQLGSLGTGAAATLIAAGDIRVLGSATATGGLTATAGQALRLGSLAAQSGALTAGTNLVIDGAAIIGGTLQATATSGAVTIDSLSAGATTLNAATNLTVTNLAKSTGALIAKATAGSVQFGSLDAASATLTAQQTLNVTGAAKTGTTLTATATAGDVTFGSLDAGSDAVLTATAGNLKLGTGLAGAVQPTARTTGKLTLLATAGTATVNGGVAAGSDYTITAGKLITLAADGATQSSATKVTLNAPDLSLSNTMTLKATDRIQLNVTGTATRVAIGDGLTAATATTYALSNTELGRISAPKFEIDADNGLATTASRTVDIGRATIADPVTTFAVKARGDITLTDLLEFKTPTGGTARTMTLGGSLDGGPLDKAVATNPGAASIRVLTRLGLDNAAGGTGGQISAAGSTVGLRANYIVLGDRPTAPDAGQPFVDGLLAPVGSTAADLPRTIEYVRANFFANASSTLYRALPGYTKQAPNPQAIVTAGTLILAPTQFALIQNTGVSSQIAGGIDLATLKLIKLGTVDPIIAVFGKLDGQNGVVASVRISAEALDGISPNNVRINGCIALQSASCILTGVSLPIIKLVDPGDALLVSNNAGLALPIDLVTGASNELLWRDDDDDDDNRRKADPDSAPVSTTGATAPADVARPSESK